MPRVKPIPPQSRTSGRINYTVKAGESLASIAQKQYGDARFARLIFTINRGEITTTKDGKIIQACLWPSQIIMLPNEAELNVYCRHFFTESSKIKFDLSYFARPAMPSDSEFAQQNFGAKLDFQPTSVLQKQVTEPSAIGSTTARQTPSPADKQHAAPAPTAQLTASYWGQPTALEPTVSTLHPPNINTIQQGSTAFTQQLNCGSTDKFKIAEDHELFRAKGTLEVTALSHYCRMLCFDATNQSNDMVVKLQIYDSNNWQTIAAYSISAGTVRRLTSKGDGSSEAVTLELPREIARELSLRDFQRNWKNYSQVYLNEREKMRLSEAIAPSQRMLKAV
jgi:hypothetical protein